MKLSNVDRVAELRGLLKQYRQRLEEANAAEILYVRFLRPGGWSETPGATGCSVTQSGFHGELAGTLKKATVSFWAQMLGAVEKSLADYGVKIDE